MKSLYIFALTLIVMATSCKDECINDDCPVSPQSFYLKILLLDSTNRSPYLEPNKFLNEDSLEIINLTNNEAVSSNFQDSIIILEGAISINSIKILYSKSISDIVTIEKNTSDSECCARFINGVNIVFSDTTFICGKCNPILRYLKK